jgi:copper resistance protein D
VAFGAWDLAAVLVKALAYATTFAAAGGVWFLGYCRTAISALAGLRIRRLIVVLVIGGIAASGVRIFVLAGLMSSDFAGMFDMTYMRMIIQGGEGRATAVRIVGLGLAAVAVAPQCRFLAVAVGGAMVAATSFAWVGHPQAAAPQTPAVLLVSVHLLGVAFWFGALMPLLIVARDPERERIAIVARRFAQAAAIMVASLVAAGIGLLWILLGQLSNLWASDYGHAVVLKLGLVACLLVLAALNKWRLTPHLHPHVSQAVRALRRSIKAELVLVGLILLTTAAFTTLIGPPSME